MGSPSEPVSQALIYLTFAAFLFLGLFLAWKYRKQTKMDFIHSGRTQTAIPVALNFVASALGSSILVSYPEIATIAGLQGAITYAACSALPLMGFAILAPIIRRRSPDGFILTMWVKDRFGTIASLYLSFLTVATMFLYMVAELSSIQQVLGSLTGLDPLPIMIVEVAITSIYTSLGGFRISFITDNVQGAIMGMLIIICAIAIGTSVSIDRTAIGPSRLTQDSELGYQLIYILLVAIITNDMFLSGFWMRAFASKTDKDLWIGVSIATVAVFVILLLIASTGLIAAWSGVWTPGEYGGLAFFLLVEKLPAWVVGFVIVMVCCLSCAVFDSLQSAMVSTISNDMFRNKLPLIYVRVITIIIIIPTIVIALKSPSILRIFLISDIFSAACIPAFLLGLFPSLYFINGFDAVIGGFGGILSVWIFGTIYYGNAYDGAQLLILVNGLYANDWSVFGTFVAAPVGSIVFLALSVVVRTSATWVFCKTTGRHFGCFDKPLPPPVVFDERVRDDDSVITDAERGGLKHAPERVTAM
ncbi:hypothetical protein DFP73DRAFT_545685 [Morchella snyderi]|nr:hypothetical protein DFP73DRAFT_545685 [Morchella snyderi]